MGNCIVENCELPQVTGQKECILHCPKKEYQDDKRNGILNLFYSELIVYILKYLKNHSSKTQNFREEQIREYLTGFEGVPHPVKDMVKNNTLVFTSIVFPERDSRDVDDYGKVLARLGKLHFNSCAFYSHNIELTIPLYFLDCTFHNVWFLYNHSVLENAHNVIYQNCKFLQDINSVSDDYPVPELDNNMFCDCEFKGAISINNLTIKGMIFQNVNTNTQHANVLDISNCTINSKFILNNYQINSFKCESTIFLSKFEFKYNDVKSFSFLNCNFNSLLNSTKTNFEELNIEKCIFNEYVGFQNCHFGTTENLSDDSKNAGFKYVTFNSFVNFRNASFLNGLDIQESNFKAPPNFLNAFVSFQNTNRETFRNIKYSFDRVGNYIEGNKFFVLEIKKYRDEIKIKRGAYSKKILLDLYGVTSNFGQSFIRPIVSIVIISILYWLVVSGYEINLLYSIYPEANKILSVIADVFNTIAKGILPFSRILKEGMEFVSLLFYITFTSLIWLVILAIKRSTKR